MILTLANVLYVLVAVAMTALILLQRGAGAAAGSGFGAGASATVFGARGASNFLSKSTAVLAALFFILSLGMAIYATKVARPDAGNADDLGVMGGAAPAASFETPAAPPAATPVAPAPASTAPAEGEVPAATPVAPAAEEVPATPAEGSKKDDKGG